MICQEQETKIFSIILKFHYFNNSQNLPMSAGMGFGEVAMPGMSGMSTGFGKEISLDFMCENIRQHASSCRAEHELLSGILQAFYSKCRVNNTNEGVNYREK